MDEGPEPNDTRFEKLSFAGVAGFEGGFECPAPGTDRGVDLPEIGGVGRRAAKAELELMRGGFFGSCELVVQLNPERSSIA